MGIYFKNLLRSLAEIDSDNAYFLFSSSLKDRFHREKLPDFKKMRFRDFPIPVKAMNFLWYRLGWPRLDFFLGSRLDLTHSPTPLHLPTAGKRIVTVYDLFFMENPEWADRESRTAFRRAIARSLEKADGVITISHFTKNQLLELFPLQPGKVRSIYLGLDPPSWGGESLPSPSEFQRKLGLPSSFLLFVGALEKRKNIPRLLDAFSHVHRSCPDVSLVLAGREGEDSGNIRRKIKELGLEEEIRMLGYCRERDLKYLYRLADAFVFPSLLEGFGLPLLEAMASGLPVAASRTSAITEIAGDAAVFFDPLDTENMADILMTLIKDSSLRGKLSTRGKLRASEFTWKKTARQTLDFYREIMG